ncbi:MAG: hypothetical protein A3H51_00055 [Candidatus Spechtbacteria bacterium RIFCSPLOWO2_02_FULL_38_8]|uniref:Uncharacterized protein n=1 Tax=Candidatus Spechtbacteria bacterium RIFCSPLOWO2_02_FULL_38_8 TaxID=1802164 RepID=A0A1G2HHJ8_9BACT|nr:MAG: hypothetical protein A3H51_00055 [Candidatus Spechtbacteria bacterium RIFCSPLOWO2_02_FULL_38_8]
MIATSKQRVGFISRIDYLSPGFRKGLLEVAARYFKYENVDFLVLGGGLVSMRDFGKRKKRLVEELIEKCKLQKLEEMEKEPEDRTHIPTQQEIRENTHQSLMDDIAKELSRLIPVFKNKDDKTIKIYIVLSTINAYDGAIGSDVADRLQQLREDIVFWDETSGRFPIKGIDKDFWVLLSERAPWRNKYFSTGPDRLVEDKQMQSSQTLPSLWVAGCGAVSIYRPAGELSRPRITLPALHKLQEVIAAENQIGIRIVEFKKNSTSQPCVITYDFKSFASEEKNHIPISEKANSRQRRILEAIQNEPQTIGMLEDALSFSRETIENEIVEYGKSKLQPAIVRDKNSGKGKYNIDPGWLQTRLRFRTPSPDTFKEDSILAFGCLHAGYRKTQYQYFINRVPELILQHNVKCLAGAGDFIAGLKHNLHLRGEIYAGFDYSTQEELAADLIAGAMLKVFRVRFKNEVDKYKKKFTPKVIEELVRAALLLFYYIEGNHDKWVLDLGMQPLNTFILCLKKELENGIHEELSRNNLVLENVRELVSDHVIYGRESTLPSGITLSMRHPEMGRMMTSSGRAQQTLDDADGQVLLFANFHVGTEVLRWEEETGQRLALQAGTLVSGTDFEDGKNKSVDTGVAVTKIYSHEGRIIKTATFFDSASEDKLTELPDASEIKQSLLKSLNI